MPHARFITVPKTAEVAVALDYDQAQPEDLIEWKLSEEEFTKLLEIFKQINDLCDKIIDDFESEEITEKADLEKSYLFINQINTNQNSTLKQLAEMVNFAYQFGTGVYF